MENQLETLSKSELVELVLIQRKDHRRLEKTTVEKDRKVAELDRRIAEQQHQLERKDELIAQFQRMLFGQKRERFEAPDNQIPLPFEAAPEQEKQPLILLKTIFFHVFSPFFIPW